MAVPRDYVENGKPHDLDPDLQSFSTSIQVISEKTLVRINKTSIRSFIRSCQNEEEITCLWESLFLTFSTRSASKGQTQAACNAIVNFLENCSSSSVPAIKNMPYSHRTWLAVFEMVLTRFDDATPKPMKQVLSGLFKLLKNHPDAAEAQQIYLGVIAKIMPGFILAEPRSRLKPSLVSLERLVRESGMTTSTLMSLLYDWLVEHYDEWQPLYISYCQALSLDISRFQGSTSRYLDTEPDLRHSVAAIFSLAILIHAKEQGFMSTGGTLLAFISKNAELERGDSGVSCFPLKSWIQPTKHVMLHNMDFLEQYSRSVLFPLLESDIKAFRAFIGELPLALVLSGNMVGERSVDEFILVLSALGIGKKIGFVHEDQFESRTAATRNADPKDVLILESNMLGHFLLHNEPRVRLLALSLLITAPVMSKPISANALNSILAGLHSIHADSDSYTRQETMHLMRSLIIRLRGPGAQKDFMEREGRDSKIFMERYANFLEGELLPTASYQRHISALKSISLLLNSGVDTNARHVPQEDQILWRYRIEILRPSLFRLLVDLLLDPFDEVRATALYLIGLFPKQLINTGNKSNDNDTLDVPERLKVALEKAESLASRTSRADHADTVARLYYSLYFTAKDGALETGNDPWFLTKVGIVNEILQRLEVKLSQETGIFQSSVRDAPLHGHTSALRYIVATPQFYATLANSVDEHGSSWRAVHDRIIAVCQNIWTKVKPVLCIDSPEGHTDELIDDFMVGPKDLLSYSWRALKDSSILLHAIVENPTYSPLNKGEGMQRADFEAIGSLSFVQLSELRHRGAFTSVAQTFAACCLRCAKNVDSEISHLPNLWYQDSLKMIQQQASKLTRRSAGLPALVNGICIAKSQDALFEQIMKDLREIASSPAIQASSYNELSLPQVHAMNCLKDVLANAKLASCTERHIMSIFRLGADSLSSPIWAIRNCGLMLFHASINRMCVRQPGVQFGFSGVSGVEPNMTLSFPKYEGLTQLLAQLLTSADVARSGDEQETEPGVPVSNETEKVFPALEVITEKIPSESDDDDDDLLRGLVVNHVKSKIWAVREQAARVYASLIRVSDMLSSIDDLMKSDLKPLKQNHLHGILLCARFVLLRVWHSNHWSNNIENNLLAVRKIFTRFYPYVRSPLAQTTLFDLLIDVLESNINSNVQVISRVTRFVNDLIQRHSLKYGLAELVNGGPQSPNRANAMRAEALLRRSLTWCLILNNTLTITGSTYDDEGDGNGGDAEEEGSSPAGLMGPFFDLSSVDSDAACWILDRIRTVFGSYETQRGFLPLYLLILLQGFHDENVKAGAASNLAEILEDALERKIEVDFARKWARVSDHLSMQSEENVWSRELTQSIVRLQGSLMTLKYSYGEDAITEQGGIDSLALRRWAVTLRSALSEETVYSARWSAIMSLKPFSRILRKPNQTADTSPTSLEVYLILYDMLNDDDDELRSLSAPIASWILSHSVIFPDQTVLLGSVPASESLVQFITVNYSTLPALFAHSVARLMKDMVVDVSDGEQSTTTTTTTKRRKRRSFKAFADLFEEYTRESLALFEEEKQNLFIDGVREIDIWTKCLMQMNPSVYDLQTINRLMVWVRDGLAYLNDKISSSSSAASSASSASSAAAVLSASSTKDENKEEKDGEDNILGWSSKPEVYTLGCLLFSVASFLVQKAEISEKRLLEEALKTLKERGQRVLLHPHWLVRIESACSVI